MRGVCTRVNAGVREFVSFQKALVPFLDIIQTSFSGRTSWSLIHLLLYSLSFKWFRLKTRCFLRERNQPSSTFINKLWETKGDSACWLKSQGITWVLGNFFVYTSVPKVRRVSGELFRKLLGIF